MTVQELSTYIEQALKERKSKKTGWMQYLNEAFQQLNLIWDLVHKHQTETLIMTVARIAGVLLLLVNEVQGGKTE